MSEAMAPVCEFWCEGWGCDHPDNFGTACKVPAKCNVFLCPIVDEEEQDQEQDQEN